MDSPREPADYDEVYMQQHMPFYDSLKDLKNLREQLYSAAAYFELSYSNDNKKDVVLNMLEDYAIKALVNTVDHLGSATCKVNNMLDEQVDEVSATELRMSCIEQRLRTCPEYLYRKTLSQQPLVINTSNHHKRYILPVGETMHGAYRVKSKYQGCSFDDGDEEWHQFKNAIRSTIYGTPPPAPVGKGSTQSPSPRLADRHTNFSFSNLSSEGSETRALSPQRFPASISSSGHTTPVISYSTTPNRTHPSTPHPSLRRQLYVPEPRMPASMGIRAGNVSPRKSENNLSKGKHLFKSLLSWRKKRDDGLHTHLDEY